MKLPPAKYCELDSYIKKLGALLKQRQDGIASLQKRLKKLETRSKRRGRA